MKAVENKIIYFLEGHDKSFVIPVYQRNYDWNKANCKQLFNDLIDVIQNKLKSHFFGSIVYLYNDENEEYGQEFMIIDGQQRITTLSLLMLALVHTQEETGKDENLDINLIRNEYLIGKYNHKEKIKLKPVKNDAAALKALFEKNEKQYNNSNLVTNYIYFKEQLKQTNVTLTEIFNAIKKLDVVDIKLKMSEDNPQLIFESLNSTGLDLSEADKVRNFILMKLQSDKQNEYYEKYWNNIEKNTKYNVSNFLRDFLTFKERKVPNINKVYFTFKEYIIKNDKTTTEELLKELLTLSEYYNCIIEAKFPNKNVNEILIYLNKLETTVVYPFLLDVLNDYYNLKILNDENLLEILLLIEAFLVRRLICDVPTNALNKIFMTLGRDIKNFEDYKDNYVEILKYILSQKRSNQRFPNDEELRERMIVKNLYNMNAKNNMHILERLENFNNRELIDLQKLLTEGKLTIEHIMPQTLSNNWKNELGAEYENIHNTYLHTIGNLTLTAYNSEMYNKSFLEKKTIEGGFLQSKLYLNDFVQKQNTWNKENILERAKLLIERAIHIWKSCQTNYENKRDIENTYSLDDEIDFTGEKIKFFSIKGQKITVDYWFNFLQQLCIILYDLEPAKFRNILNENEINKRATILANDESKLRTPLKITEDLYIEGHQSTEYILFVSKYLLKKLEIDIEEVSICLRENKFE
jgi:uncharacterized protein with ParB-like and HNH nuclease domain